jgi:acyl-CoA thioester hydrolase
MSDITHPAADPVTFRGIVYPWHQDHMGHMNVQHYVGMFDQATWVFLAWLGLDSEYFSRHHRGMAALEQTIAYKSELRAGDIFEIRSNLIEVREKTIRFQHTMSKLNPNVLAASTIILGVHLDTDARKSLPFPPELRNQALTRLPSNNRQPDDVTRPDVI